ncbi:DUF3703 domain-containing protein [Hydrogenophaga sp.]|jgi:hypothetical protein|uniref:DUF3703 domain-containing protein n=2 Tax=Hydrogenophaga sp. TaxID=1904254 RepID=UPI0025C43CE7|nr:DUF3703 domain-containing protein [Hydrogenophaga sp.]
MNAMNAGLSGPAQTLSVLFAMLEETPSRNTHHRWQLLEAAHVVGQGQFVPHLQTHALMLREAVRQRDGGEVAGQLFRLALVPLGHLTGRLPLGNIGRATVSAFQPMEVALATAELIAQASRRADMERRSDTRP